MAARQLSNGSSEGHKLGQSASDLIGFYGETPVIQPAATAQSAVATTAITALVTTPTATDIAIAVNSVITRQDALITLTNRLRADLVTLGLINGAA